ncbi:unnamed protein product [Allacma fusca]|uniref:Tetraspanin n=1 Tax=Allacma fusca TaxID=39272 RepID=A0A8J2Q4Z3_9HEXA|nr:unnamed protein product [Allacma fusca]
MPEELEIVEAFKRKAEKSSEAKRRNEEQTNPPRPPSEKNWFYNLCGDSIVHFREWKWLEWLLFACLMILGMYAIGGLSGNVNNLLAWDNVATAESATLSPVQINLVIAAQDILLDAAIMGILYLTLLRNVLGFLLALILLVLSAIIVIAIMIYLLTRIAAEKSLYDEILRNVKERMERMNDKFNLDSFQIKYQCCGIVNYKDWKLFKSVRLVDSVPTSCCKKSVSGLDRLNCGLQALLSNEKNLKGKINTKGCGKHMAREYRNLLIRFLVEDALILLLIIFTIVVLIILFVIWYRKTHPKEVIITDPREQENDAESAIVPGTPLKSYISSSEKLYYAP